MRPTRLPAALVAAFLAATPAAAQSPQPPAPPAPELRLPEQLDQAFREMMERLKPALEELMDTMQVFEDIDGLENYERPEILPNGDIIIRRREDAPPWPPEEPPAAEPEQPGDSVKT